MSRLVCTFGALMVAALSAVGCAPRSGPAPAAPAAQPVPTTPTDTRKDSARSGGPGGKGNAPIHADYSNIRASDYVGPAVCGKCHEKNHSLWSTHAHRRMNQTASAETVKGDFSGVRVDYSRGQTIFEREGDTFFMSIFEGGKLWRRHRVTRTVGSLYMQYYIGTQVEGPEAPGHPTYTRESKLPFAYSYKLERWLPEVFFDSTYPPDARFLDGTYPDLIYDEAPVHLWNNNCMTCHNTYPYEVRLWQQPVRVQGALWQGGFPRTSVVWRGERHHQGTVPDGEQQALAADRLVTVGISCESCHFGGREHALNSRRISFVPRSKDLTIVRPGSGGERVESDRKDPFVINGICAQCHNASLTPYPDGSPAINSSESLGLALGACTSEIKCIDCHDPHTPGALSGAEQSASHVRACLSCHRDLDEPEARARHTRHGDDISCLDCHMPRIVAGLDTVSRTHTISKPIPERMLATGAPNACNLCHLDQSIAWTLDALDDWGAEVPDGDQVARWYGKYLDLPMAQVWRDSRISLFRMAATEAHTRSPLVDDPVPALLIALDDEIAFNRTFAFIALQRVLGGKVDTDEYDILGDAERRREQLRRMADALIAGARGSAAGR